MDFNMILENIPRVYYELSLPSEHDFFLDDLKIRYDYTAEPAEIISKNVYGSSWIKSPYMWFSDTYITDNFLLIFDMLGKRYLNSMKEIIECDIIALPTTETPAGTYYAVYRFKTVEDMMVAKMFDFME